jgi:hypothetical protein
VRPSIRPSRRSIRPRKDHQGSLTTDAPSGCEVVSRRDSCHDPNALGESRHLSRAPSVIQPLGGPLIPSGSMAAFRSSLASMGSMVSSTEAVARCVAAFVSLTVLRLILRLHRSGAPACRQAWPPTPACPAAHHAAFSSLCNALTSASRSGVNGRP